jgi:soluble lytic murein transglycosylase
MVFPRVFILLLLLLCPTPGYPDIYKTVDKDGVICFTNHPASGAELVVREAPKEAPAPRAAGVRAESPASQQSNAWVYEYADRYSRANKLPPALVKAIIKAESNGRRTAVSNKGAKGCMQLMPFTSKRFKVDDPFDPVQNIEGGILYIKELLTLFRGDMVHTVAAYNAGPGAVRKYGGVPPYAETRGYVKRVMSLYRQYALAE